MAKPNVLLVCVDHFPGLLTGAAGHSHILTPTLDRLCQNGTRFSQTYSSTPTCIPARRALMTGTTAKTHGDRVFKEFEPMDPNLPTMAQCFRDAGYQAYAVGKMHVYPQRDRIGFDDVILNEEGRHHLGGGKDDYELFLEREGYPGAELAHAMGNNVYTVRPWHLPEYCHPTNWTAREMCRTIQRRDPTKPAFWYCSFIAPHPPITPPKDYLDMYLDLGVDDPIIGDWAKDPSSWPYALRAHRAKWLDMSEKEVCLARAGFYAQCTYIDHQLRLVIGTLREEGLLEDTHIMLTCDHGDMLGHHNLFCKPPMFEFSAKIPMIFSPAPKHLEPQRNWNVDERLAELRDVMPTLLNLCDVPVPETVEGLDMLGDEKRDHLYCEHHEDERAMRMVRKDQHKLIWYPVGNRLQLFDLGNDPMECRDLADDPGHDEIKKELEKIMVSELYGSDLKWTENDALVGEPDTSGDKDISVLGWGSRSLLGQRGWR